MKYQHIVFDLDGTLMDTERAILPALRDTLLARTGKHYPEEELTFALGITGADALKRLGVDDIDGVLALWVDNMHRYQDAVTLFSGVEEVLKALRDSGVTLGIVTSQTYEEFDHGFVPLGVSGYFQVAIRAEDTEEHKPAPAPLLKYMELSGARPEEVLYVGDSVYDSRCAQAAGVDFALALWGTHDPAIPAVHRLQRPAELLSL